MRTLALDLGNRRIGVAISDTLSMFARPLEVFLRTSRVADFAHIQALIDADRVQSVVAGLPLNMDGTEGQQAAWVRDYAAALGEAISMPVILWDERLTTEEAKDILRAQGKRPNKDWIDAVAAAVILQSYLDAQVA
ncbi:MAG: Holliday junction resolvase RuvX [Anaerolineae bacterium]|nr:Holliday junction resolvase RuvX [Anaerolineae bacterium]